MSHPEYKAQAKRLGAHLAQKHRLNLKHSALLEAVAALHGSADWNTLIATGPAGDPEGLVKVSELPVLATATTASIMDFAIRPVPALADLSIPCAKGWLAVLSKREPGLHLIVGATGNGKTTTKLSTARTLASIGRRCLVVTSQMEYSAIPKVNYLLSDPYVAEPSQWRKAIMSAATHKGSDVVFLSAIRDERDAELAQALCEAGRTVVACMHANGFAGAVERLRHMGIEPLSASGALLKSVLHLKLERAVEGHRQEQEHAHSKLMAGLTPRISKATLTVSETFTSSGSTPPTSGRPDPL